MKETGRITRITIENNQEQEFSFLGIVTSETDYRLSLLINKKLGISLKHSGEEITTDNKNLSLSFSKFETPDHNYALVSNKSDAGTLLHKLNKIDFLFLTGKKNRNTPDSLASSFREIPGVNAIFVFNSKEIKEKNIEVLREITN